MAADEKETTTIFDEPGDDEQEPENKAMGEGGIDVE